VTEANYGGKFTVTSDNAAAVSVVGGNGAQFQSTSGSATVNVTAVASGTANITIVDDFGQQIVVSTRVTISTVTIGGTHRH